MYERIEAQIVLSGVSKRELAKRVGISYNTLNIKLNGKSAFTLDEALQIKKEINANEPIEALFDG